MEDEHSRQGHRPREEGFTVGSRTGEGAGRLRVPRMKAVTRYGQVTTALGRMQVGEDCSVVLNLIQ